MLTLIGSALSPYVMRVVIAARYKQLTLPLLPSMESESAGVRVRDSLGPIGRVPVLREGEWMLPESDVILSYLDDRFPEPSLLPGSPAQRSNARLLGRLVDTYSTPSFGMFAGSKDSAALVTAIGRIDVALGYVDHLSHRWRVRVGKCLFDGGLRTHAVVLHL